MPRRLSRRFLLWGLLSALIAGSGFAIAGTLSLESGLIGDLQASAPPALLGPITESGRNGWKCKPERAALARRWQDAELPTDFDDR